MLRVTVLCCGADYFYENKLKDIFFCYQHIAIQKEEANQY